jgi:tetratricopeptide (TPR) repeat protein
MSPEQAEGRLDELSPASDVYSLGATLYVLLTGKKPFDGADAEEVLSAVRRGRFVPPRLVKPGLAPALDAVCLKAMALRPADRYATALDLAADVEHWLADEPVAAYPEPWTARAARWARRHRTALVAAAALLVSAVVALSVGTTLVWREQRKTAEQKQIAEDNLKIARNLSFNSIDLVASSEASFTSDRAQRARREVLKAAALACHRYLQHAPDDPGLWERSAQVYRYTANVLRLGYQTREAEPLYQDSVRLYERLAGRFPEDKVYQEKLSETLRDYSELQEMTGRLREAADVLGRATKIAQALAAEGPDRVGSRLALALALLDRSGIEYTRGSVAESGKTARRAIELFLGLAALPPANHHPYTPLLLAAALNRAAVAERESGRLDAAQPLHAEAIQYLRKVENDRPEGVNPRDIAHVLALCQLEQCRTWARTPRLRANAEINLGKAAHQWDQLSNDSPGIPSYRMWLGVAYLTRGRVREEENRAGEARADFDRARQLFEELLKESPGLPSRWGDLGGAYAGLGRLARKAGDRAATADWFGKAADALGKAVAGSPDNAQDRRSRDEVLAEQAK